MPVRTTVATASLLVATLATAAALNLAVMGLGRSDDGAAAQTDPAEDVASLPEETSGISQVELTSAAVTPIAAPVPVLAVGVASPTDAPTQSEPAAPTVAAAPTTEAPGTSALPATQDPTTSATRSTGASADTSVARPTVPTTAAPTTPPTDRPSTSPTTVTPTTATVTEYLTYEFEGIASIIVALHDGERLEYWSVAPEPGWVFLVEDRGPREVKVKFRPAKGGEEAEFEVKFDGDRLKVKREY